MQPAQVSSTKLTNDDCLLFPDDGRVYRRAVLGLAEQAIQPGGRV